MNDNGGDKIIAAGSLMTLTFGAYSDYRVNALVVAQRTFTPNSALAEFRKVRPANDGEYESHECFVSWLARNGWVAELEHGEWCMGGYSLMDEDASVHQAFEVKP